MVNTPPDLPKLAKEFVSFVSGLFNPSQHDSINTKQPTKQVSKETNELFLNGCWYRFEFSNSKEICRVSKKSHRVVVSEFNDLGKKLQPVFEPHYKFLVDIGDMKSKTLEEAVHKLIVSNYANSISDISSPKQSKEESVSSVSSIQASHQYPKIERKQKSSTEDVSGLLVFSGKKQFADKNKPGQSYSNFCLEIQAGLSSRILQGEALQNKLVEVGGVVGDEVLVRRLGKVQIPVIDKVTQAPRLDSSGKPMMNSMWEWDIKILKKGK